jgi:hypothetical protein
LIARRLCLTVLLAFSAVASADAQTSLGALGYFTFGSVAPAAGDTFEAVTGKRQAPSVGVGVQVTGLWRHIFVDVAYSRQWLDGERVFVLNDMVFPLGIPVNISFEPLDVAAGWRFRTGRVMPYVGGGLSSIKYTETSDFAEPGDDVDERKSGALILAGVDVPIGRWLLVGGELRYRAVTGVLGNGGVSAAFGEDELGGVSYAVRLSVGR